MSDTPPKPYYSIEAIIGTEWKIRFRMKLRSASIDLAKELAQHESINHHVYVHTRSGQRKHVFTARSLVS